MEEPYETERLNGEVTVEVSAKKEENHESLHGLLRRLTAMILFPDPNSSTAGAPLLHRIKISVSENGPRLRDASRNTAEDVLLWTRSGSPLRALLVISVGTITLLALTGVLVFMLFFLAATINAIVISLLMSLAAAGGFLALFFACVTAIYIGALCVAMFVISSATISAMVAVLITTGWIGFFWTMWLATKKSMGLAKHSLSMTGSALSAYSVARHARRHRDTVKVSD